jgi:hypothetical protein
MTVLFRMALLRHVALMGGDGKWTVLEVVSMAMASLYKAKLATHLSLRRMTLRLPTSGNRQFLPVNTYRRCTACPLMPAD